MEYDHDSVCKIVENYTLLRDSIKELGSIKKEGAVLGWASGHYEKGKTAVEFLNTIPSELQERLNLRKLEAEFSNLGNTHIKL